MEGMGSRGGDGGGVRRQEEEMEGMGSRGGE